ncbi:MAG: LamG-like jellyroll fold domain-containing protein [Povalibacter sp.]
MRFPFRTVFVVLACISLHVGIVYADVGHTAALSFDGANDVATIVDRPSLSPAHITVEGWIQPQSIATTNSQDRIISKGTSYELTISTGDTGCASGTQGSVQWRATIAGKDLRICGGQLSLNEWHHIAGTYDGATFQLYVDGARVASLARTGAIAVTTTSVTLGNRPTIDRGFDGLLDEVRIWSRALTQTEIQTLSDTTLQGTETNLVAYYRLDESSGQVINDATANSNDGVLGTSSAAESSDPGRFHASANTAPIADAGADQTIVLPTNSVQLFGSAQDDGLPTGTLTAHWTRTSGPGTATFANSNAMQTRVTFSTAGVYVLQLTVSDGELSDSDSIRITVSSPQSLSRVELHPRFVTMKVGSQQNFWVTALDGSGNRVNVTPTWTVSAGSMSSAGVYTAPTQTGAYTITASVSGLLVRGFVDVKSTVYWPTTSWSTTTPATMGMDATVLAQSRDYALTGGGSGMIIRGGRLVMSWGSATQRYDIKSSTKSMGGTTALGLAIMDGLVDLNDAAQMHLPSVGVPPDSNTATGWLDDITLLNLATHTAGFQKPGGYTSLLFAPGTRWLYTDGGANWLADVLTTVFATDLNTVLFNRVFTPLGITTTDLIWRSNAYREDTLNGIKRREFGAGILTNVNAMSRFAYMYLRRGQWNGQRILADDFVEQAQQPPPEIDGIPVRDTTFPATTTKHYGLLWWTNADSTLPQVPRDTYWAWGLGDIMIFVIPSLDIVAIRAGTPLTTAPWHGDYGYLDPLIGPIAKSVIAKVAVPSVVNQTEANAKNVIDQAALAVSSLTRQSSSTIASGRVISQSPGSGSKVARNTGVKLVISSGP